ncbi:MAG: hypothetical protein ACYCVL_14680 [Gemmatimonadaceae bacterium]
MTQTDFRCTRDLLDRLDRWVSMLVVPLGTPIRGDDQRGGFLWDFPQKTPELLQVGKLVRMVSGIRAAMLLADYGYTTESASLLRMVSDFGQEIMAVGEALLEGRLDDNQKRFVDQYFAPPPSDPAEYAARERERYVSRNELFKATRRMVEKTSESAEDLAMLTKFLNAGFDMYVHGGYATAMELYHGGDGAFMLSGHKGEQGRCIARTAVAGKLHEVLIAVRFMAMTRRMRPLADELAQALARLVSSDEMSSEPCKNISGRQAAV